MKKRKRSSSHGSSSRTLKSAYGGKEVSALAALNGGFLRECAKTIEEAKQMTPVFMGQPYTSVNNIPQGYRLPTSASPHGWHHQIIYVNRSEGPPVDTSTSSGEPSTETILPARELPDSPLAAEVRGLRDRVVAECDKANNEYVPTFVDKTIEFKVDVNDRMFQDVVAKMREAMRQRAELELRRQWKIGGKS